jgi:GH15 family glucan-1,4-alpha-glucosidase
MRPSEDHGLIGDTRTAALVDSTGAINWMCVPAFDGQPVFGALIGGPDAGRFTLGPARATSVASRRYRTDTATLETSWATPSGKLTLTEGMVADLDGRLLPTTMLVRRLEATGAPVKACVEFDPRLGRGRRRPHTRRRGNTIVCTWDTTAISLRADTDVAVEPARSVELTVAPGRPVTFVLGVAHREPVIDVDPDTAWRALLDVERRWRDWCGEIVDDVVHRDAVVRSLLTLRLLEYSPSGAPVAAPTTSLPELLGGGRNWDYRYAWPRDASIGIGAFLGVGKPGDARRFLAWLLHASRLDRPRLPVLLTLHGRHPHGEAEWSDWPGYAGSVPVRVGNGADTQHQLDGYGWVIDAAWLLTDAGHRLYGETWRAMRRFADEVAERWREPDAGIWEIRGGEDHHVHSKLMAWLALDRAVRIATTRRTPARELRRWIAERTALGTEIRQRGFDAARSTYTRTYGSDDLDAALLVLPLIGIEPNDSPRVRSTIDAVRGDLSAGGPWLYRYPPGADGLDGTEGAFVPCSFWLAQADAATGRIDDAAERVEQLVDRASPLGLYSEEVDPATGGFLGNFPQALSHAGLVQAVLALRNPFNEAANIQTPSPASTSHERGTGAR